MTLQTIRIVHIKGIRNKTFNLNIIPNRPSLLYAPNGFGKSSLAIGFNSLKTKKIELHKDHLYEDNDVNRPQLELTFERANRTIATLVADDTSNTINTEFDCYVINNQVRAKGVRLKFGGRTNYSASMAIDSVVLTDNIPPEQKLPYSILTSRQNFGHNGKVLRNLNAAFNIPAFLKIFLEQVKLLERLCGVQNQRRIDQFKERLNQQEGTAETLLDWIEINELAVLDSIDPLRILSDSLVLLNRGFARRTEDILSVLQILDLYKQDKAAFKRYLERRIYESEKKSYIESFKAFNATWKDIRPKEKDGALVVEFPKAIHISNGQRDILCLIGHLERARRKLKKNQAILIIDEIFDYLDEANLVAAQYYINEFIESFRKAGKRIYPLILTHINLGFFIIYSFKKLKVYYLDNRTPAANGPFVALLQQRDDPLIQNDVSQLLLHFHPGQINKRAEFAALGLRQTWGEQDHFKNYLDLQLQNYLTATADYDPFAVCCAVRRKIEENVYNQIGGAAEQNVFLATHMTIPKLEYAESIGIVVPEYYYLLAIVYNDGMHWHQNRDNFSPLAAKLENGVIRKLISDI